MKLAKEVAIAAAYEAGRLIKNKFGTLVHIVEKDEYGDVVTEVDHEAEQLILIKIKSVFPDHRIRSEEIGDNEQDSDWLWLIDPLDGTNNFAVSLPVFAVSITLVYQSQPVVAVIYEPMTDCLYTAIAGEGAWCNGKAISAQSALPLKKAKVGWIQGHHVQNDSRAVRLRHYVDLEVKRMMRLWAPTLQWCMLARGDLDAIIVYDSEGEDLYSGLLLAREAGCDVIHYNGHLFNGINDGPYLIACLPGNREYFLRLVESGLTIGASGEE